MVRRDQPREPWTWQEIAFIAMMILLYGVLPILALVVVILTWCGEAGC